MSAETPDVAARAFVRGMLARSAGRPPLPGSDPASLRDLHTGGAEYLDAWLRGWHALDGGDA